MDAVEERVKRVALEEADKIKHVSHDAVVSGAYMYPIKGIIYFLGHRDLWKPLASKLVPTLTLGSVVTAGMFLVTYVPQAAMMAFTEGPAAPFSAALLVLNESSSLVNWLSKSLLVHESLVDTFDGTLIAKDQSGLVAEGRELKRASDPIGRLGKAFKKPFQKYSADGLIRYIMYMPLNFIPVVGTMLFIIVQGQRYGPTLHERYFQLKQLSTKERDEFVEKRRGAYTSFGIVATLLETVPVASILFAFTNTVAAALWAADMERESSTAPQLQQQAKKAK